MTLVALLAGDPAPTHRAALLRQPETDNTKEPPARRCRVIWQSGKECDISEFADMSDLYGDRPLLTRKEKPNGHAHAHTASDDTRSGPVDVEALLAEMSQADCNNTHIRVIPALIWRAWHPDKVLDYLLAPTLKVCGGDKAQQAAIILGRIKSAIKNLFMREYDPAGGEIRGGSPKNSTATGRQRWRKGSARNSAAMPAVGTSAPMAGTTADQRKTATRMATSPAARPARDSYCGRLAV